MRDLTSKAFIDNPVKRITINSPNIEGLTYSIAIEWHEIGANYREANKISKQRSHVASKRSKLNHEIDELKKEIKALEDGILKKYEY